MSAFIPDFDFKNPDYNRVFRARQEVLFETMRHPERWEAAKGYYKDHWADFLEHWGMTYDPRRLAHGEPALLPFLLFPRQREYVDWLYERWKKGESGLVEKSREVGISWVNIGVMVCAFLFIPGAALGVGSYVEAKVDKLGDPSSLLEKARIFLRHLPGPLLPKGFSVDKHCRFMNFMNPENGATIVGEVGDNVGRGGRTAFYFVDEAAHFEHQEAVDAALSMNTPCRIYASTVNGHNAFWKKRMSLPEDRVFVFDWRDDPRKDDEWYRQQCQELDPWIVAQEIDRNYEAALENIVIPSAWVQAAVNLKLEACGVRQAGFDPADEGKDAKAFVLRHGPVVEYVQAWKDGGVLEATRRAWALAQSSGAELMCYDNIGVGTGAKVELDRLRHQGERFGIAVQGVGVEKLTGTYEGNKLNKDMFQDYRAMSWWNMRRRFERTYQHVTGQREWPDEDMISLPNNADLISELSRPTYRVTDAGRVRVESKKEMRKRGVPSPNLADALILAFTPSSVVRAGRFGLDWRGGRGANLWPFRRKNEEKSEVAVA